MRLSTSCSSVVPASRVTAPAFGVLPPGTSITRKDGAPTMKSHATPPTSSFWSGHRGPGSSMKAPNA